LSLTNVDEGQSASASTGPKKSPNTGEGVIRRRGRGPLHAPIFKALPRRSPTGNDDDVERPPIPDSGSRAGEHDRALSTTSLQDKDKDLTSIEITSDTLSHECEADNG
jgi:hypothetical protein